jgi:hypothetical protein
VPNRSFYAFRAFKQILDTPIRLATRADPAGQFAFCAGTNPSRSEVRLLVSNFNSSEHQVQVAVEHLPWEGKVLCEIAVVDATHELTRVQELETPATDCTIALELKAPSISLITLRKAGTQN